MDIRKTVEELTTREIRVHCFALGGVDLTSSAERMTMQIIAAMIEFEQNLLIERTHSGIASRKTHRTPLGT